MQGYWNPHTHADPRLATAEFPHPHLSEAKNIVRISWCQNFTFSHHSPSGDVSVWAAGINVGRAEAEGVTLHLSKWGGGQAGRPQARGRSVLNFQNFGKTINTDHFQSLKWLLLWKRPLPCLLQPRSWPRPSWTLFSDMQRSMFC